MSPHEPVIIGPDASADSPPTQTREAAPWEEIAPGRYMPRRVRGSYPGRVLG